MVDINDKRIPIIGQKPPQMRVHSRVVANLVISDEKGSCEIAPLDDVTPIEVHRINLLTAWMLSQPPGPVPDPETGGRTGMIVRTEWRKYIEESGLERHCRFSEPAVPVAPGTDKVQ